MSETLSLLMNHLWQSTLFAILVAVVAFALRRNRAHTRYWLWLAASVKFVIPFSLLVSIGSRVEVPAVVPVVPALAVEQITTSFAPVAPLPLHTTTWPRILAGLWLAGVILLLARWFRRWLLIRSAVRSATPLPLAASIPVLSSQTSIEPGVFGIFRPVLLLPAGITTRLSAEELDAILAHELSHVHRRDNLTASIHMLVEALFWFHPLVWWIEARLVEERERACDEAVLRDGKLPEVYARGILNVCKFYLASPLPCSPGVSGADLRQRIAGIMAGSLPTQLSFARKAFLLCVCTAAAALPVAIGILNSPSLLGQSAPACTDCRFEVASIRPAAGDYRGTNIHTDRARFTTRNASLAALIQFAYGIQTYQLSGGPAWVRDNRFDIAANYDYAEDGDIPQTDQPRLNTRNERIRARLRHLLAERFQLRLREEMKDLPIYALTLDKGVHKMKPTATGSGSMNTNQNNGVGTLRGDAVPVAHLTRVLSSILGRPVVDETGLDGLFNIELSWSDNSASEGAGPTMFTALREQLGLRLESKKGPVITYVIEQAEQPSEN